MAEVLHTSTHHIPDLKRNATDPDYLQNLANRFNEKMGKYERMADWVPLKRESIAALEEWLEEVLENLGISMSDFGKYLGDRAVPTTTPAKAGGPGESGSQGRGAGVIGTMPGGPTAGGGVFPGSGTGGGGASAGFGGFGGSISQITPQDIVRMGQPPVDDNITAMEAVDMQAPDTAMGGSEAKSFLAEISAAGLTGKQTENLRRRIRTMQAARGLEFGGAAVKQEAYIVGRYTQEKRLEASTQLASLTEQEAMLEVNISRLLGESDKSITQAAIPQLTQPTRALADLYAGSSSGLSSIFGLNNLL